MHTVKSGSATDDAVELFGIRCTSDDASLPPFEQPVK
jgi:hypothetical protein